MTKNEILYILVEGPDDRRFFENILYPVINKHIKIIEYSNLSIKVIRNLLNTFKQKEQKYILICDYDAQGNSLFCITKRKDKIIQKYGSAISLDKIFVVKEEIESWYLAIMSQKFVKRFKMKKLTNTEQITKEQFFNIIPKYFSDKIDFQIEIMKDFDINSGIKINNSLNYFISKMNLISL